MVDNEYLRLVKGSSLSRSHADSEGNFETHVDLGTFTSLPKPSPWRLLMLNRPEWHFGLLGSFGAVIAGCEFPLAAFVIGQVGYLLQSSILGNRSLDHCHVCIILKLILVHY